MDQWVLIAWILISAIILVLTYSVWDIWKFCNDLQNFDFCKDCQHPKSCKRLGCLGSAK